MVHYTTPASAAFRVCGPESDLYVRSLAWQSEEVIACGAFKGGKILDLQQPRNPHKLMETDRSVESLVWHGDLLISSNRSGHPTHNWEVAIYNKDGTKMRTLQLDNPRLCNRIIEVNNRGRLVVVCEPYDDYNDDRDDAGGFQIFNLDTGVDFKFVKDRGINRVVWKNDQELFTGNRRGKIRLWREGVDAPLRIITGHSKRSWILSLAWNPVTGILASGAEDEEIRLWNLALDNPAVGTLSRNLWIKEDVHEVVWSPGKPSILASFHGDNLPQIRIWNTVAKTCLFVFDFEDNESGLAASINYNISFSPDGKFLGSVAGRYVQVWKVETGELEAECQVTGWQLKWNNSGDKLAVKTGDGNCDVFGLERVVELKLKTLAAKKVASCLKIKMCGSRDGEWGLGQLTYPDKLKKEIRVYL